MTITTHDMQAVIEAIYEAITEQKAQLNALDSELGDGDHGTTISAGFEAAVEKVKDAESPAQVLQLTAATLMNRMGGASGALFGTLFLRAAMTVKDLDDISHDQFAVMWQAGLDGVMERGKARPGDKTMVDALSPAVDALKQAVDHNKTLVEALEMAAEAAERGAQSTATMQARHGRARYVGERAIGHVDAGAQSIALMFAAMHAYWKEKANGET
jgi:dihydroxyacetone kinase-like protein